MLPAILEPVPEELVFLLAASARERNGWYEKIADEEANYWLGERELDCGYLTNAPQITIWSTTRDVIFNWIANQEPITARPRLVSYSRLLQNDSDRVCKRRDRVRLRVNAQMKNRIIRIVSSQKSDSVSIDLSQLIREQEDRSPWLANHLRRTSNTPWSGVVRLLASIQ